MPRSLVRLGHERSLRWLRAAGLSGAALASVVGFIVLGYELTAITAVDFGTVPRWAARRETEAFDDVAPGA